MPVNEPECFFFLNKRRTTKGPELQLNGGKDYRKDPKRKEDYNPVLAIYKEDLTKITKKAIKASSTAAIAALDAAATGSIFWDDTT